MSRRHFLALLLPLLAVITAFVALWALEQSGVRGAPAWDAGFARYVRDSIGREYVAGVGSRHDQEVAYFRALNEYVRAFDDYGAITPPWDADRAREASSGRYTGIGVRIEPLPDVDGPVREVLISGVKPKGPAANAGVAVGDRIVAVDGRPIADLVPNARAVRTGGESPFQMAIRGVEGTSVGLRLRAPDGTERDVSVIRAEVDDGSVFGARFLDRSSGIGYVRIEGFEASTGKDLRAALEGLAKEGLRALVLDLRGNRGGLLDQAVAVANLFLDGGVVVKQRGRAERFTTIHRADPKQTWNASIPLAVLVDQDSASASEVLAGALRDYRRAVLVGERTWGKFLVQLVEEVPTEAGIAIFKRTTSIYETPLGTSYQRTPADNLDDPTAGIPPDLLVPMADADRRTRAEIYEDEKYADWDAAHVPRVTGFLDVQIEAAKALLSGEAYCPALLP
ncbi:MAG TPA: S41 family peptidase [Planctomycetota bacterium]|nr:S41 family peptidase [Planctomycetota bacterium]